MTPGQAPAKQVPPNQQQAAGSRGAVHLLHVDGQAINFRGELARLRLLWLEALPVLVAGLFSEPPAGWNEGRLADGSSCANLASLTDRGKMLQFMHASSMRASCRCSGPRQETQRSWPSAGSRAAIQPVQHCSITVTVPVEAKQQKLGEGSSHAAFTNNATF